MPETDWLTKAWWFVTGHSQVIRDIALTLPALIGAPLVIWRTWATHQQSKAALRQSQAALEQAKIASQQADIASKRHEQQTDADRQRRITENFARAIEQLGGEKLQVRLGAIHALARIAGESPTDYWPVMETLAAFVRERAALSQLEADACVEVMERSDAENDVQAALTTLRRLSRPLEADQQPLDLSRTNLSRMDLGWAHLEMVDLELANLVGAALDHTRLWGANLSRAQLIGAELRFADLRGADLDQANLSGAEFRGANLEGARLRGADLTRARNLTQEQLNKACGDAETKLPGGLTIPFCDDEGQSGTNRDPAAGQ